MSVTRDLSHEAAQPTMGAIDDRPPHGRGALHRALGLASQTRWRSTKTVDERDLERLRVFYAALGPGFPPEAVSVFGDDEADLDWCVMHRGRLRRRLSSAELSNDELFDLLPTWELTRVEIRTMSGKLTKRGVLVSVGGYLHCRPRGSWYKECLPFVHRWTILDGTELTRAGDHAGVKAAA